MNTPGLRNLNASEVKLESRYNQLEREENFLPYEKSRLQVLQEEDAKVQQIKTNWLRKIKNQERETRIQEYKVEQEIEKEKELSKKPSIDNERLVQVEYLSVVSSYFVGLICGVLFISLFVLVAMFYSDTNENIKNTYDKVFCTLPT